MGFTRNITERNLSFFAFNVLSSLMISPESCESIFFSLSSSYDFDLLMISLEPVKDTHTHSHLREKTLELATNKSHY